MLNILCVKLTFCVRDILCDILCVSGAQYLSGADSTFTNHTEDIRRGGREREEVEGERG